MPAFNYVALKGKRQEKGVIEADTGRQVREILRARGLLPLEITKVEERQAPGKSGRRGHAPATGRRTLQQLFQRKGVSSAELSLLTRQLATLLAAGIPLDEVLFGVAEQSEKSHIKSILLGVRSRVLEGYSLATAMDQFPSAFPRLYRITVASGENSGKLDEVLTKLAEFTERQHEIKQKIRQALVYPTLMTFVSIGVVVFLLIYVVPKIINVFSQTKQALPVSTRILIAISQFLQHQGLYLLGIIFVGVIVFIYLLRREKVRRFVDGLLLRLPVIGPAIKTVNSARFGRTFGILFAATVPVLDAMNASAQLISPLPMREAVEKATDRVREGTSVSRALKNTHYFSPMFIHLLSSGESSGQLAEMLERAAKNQERDVQGLIDSLLTLFEPILILVMGGVVLFIVLAVMLPIFAMDQFPG